MPSQKQYIAPYDLANRIAGTAVQSGPVSKDTKEDAPADIPGIRFQYEKETGKKLDAPLRWNSFTTFGAKDTVTRGMQVRLLEAFAKMSVNHSDSQIAIQLNQRKYKLMVAMTYLIQKDIRDTYTTSLHGYGVLHRLLDEVLDIKNNPLDDATKIECLSTLVNASTDELNGYLGVNQLTATQWSTIKASALSRLKVLHERQVQDGVMARALGTTGYYLGRPLGIGTGFVFGRIIGESTLVYPLVKVLDLMFRALFSVTNRRQGGDNGRMASMFLARRYSDDAAVYSCGAAGAMIMGDFLSRNGFRAGRKLGQGLDYLGEQTLGAAQKMFHLLADPKNKPVKMGIHVMTGDPIFFNAAGELINIQALSAELDKLEEHAETRHYSPEEEDAVRAFVSYMQEHPSSLNDLAQASSESVTVAEYEREPEDGTWSPSTATP